MTDQDFAWLSEHAEELQQKHRGQWIAVYDGNIVGVGKTATEAAEQARVQVDGAEFVLEAIESEVDAIYGVV